MWRGVTAVSMSRDHLAASFYQKNYQTKEIQGFCEHFEFLEINFLAWLCCIKPERTIVVGMPSTIKNT